LGTCLSPFGVSVVYVSIYQSTVPHINKINQLMTLLTNYLYIKSDSNDATIVYGENASSKKSPKLDKILAAQCIYNSK
jgi:hypothetical protein